MLLADSVIVVVAGLFLVGLVGFFAMVIALVGRLFGFVFRVLTGGDEPAAPQLPTYTGQVHQVCPNPRCGHANPPRARFCARCGRRLGADDNDDDDLDEYG